MDYVLGFLFDEALERVVLIRKAKPAWQKNLFNGVGGKVEPEDICPEGSVFAAMEREFFEETGVQSGFETGILWSNFGTLNGQDYNVHIFAAKTTNQVLEMVKTTTDEEVVICSSDLRDEYLTQLATVPNLQWLVPMCRQALKDKDFRRAEVYYG